MKNNTADRSQLVNEIRSWIGTPYVLGQGVKGAGVDCARLLMAALINVGLIKDCEVEYYGHDWFHNTSQERYLYGILKYALPTIQGVAYKSLSIEPGCILATRASGSKVINHAGIVTEWPMLVHAAYSGVAEVDATRHPMWLNAKVEAFDPFLKAAQ